jgi:hypothetical protein
LLEQLGAKDAQLGAKDAQLGAKDAHLLEVLSEARRSDALVHELESVTTALLREKGIFSARGALELLLAMHTFDANEPQLAAYFARAGGLGERVLHCCNESRKVLSDHGGKLHTAESLAKLVFTIKRRLNQDAHDKRTGDEYARDGDAIVLRCNGLSQSHVALLRCLFETHGFPVRESL